MGHIEVITLLKPSGEQVILSNEVAYVARGVIYGFCIALSDTANIFDGKILASSKLNLLAGDMLVKNKTKDVVLQYVWFVQVDR